MIKKQFTSLQFCKQKNNSGGLECFSSGNVLAARGFFKARRELAYNVLLLNVLRKS
jgi:hypothetical protein